MTRDPRMLAALAAALLLSLVAVAGPGQEEAPVPAAEDAAEAPEPPLTLETLAARVERLELLVLGSRAGTGVGSPSPELPVGDPGALRLAELERRLQRIELGASTPAGGLSQLDSRLRSVESRLSRVESDLRTIRR